MHTFKYKNHETFLNDINGIWITEAHTLFQKEILKN